MAEKKERLKKTITEIIKKAMKEKGLEIDKFERVRTAAGINRELVFTTGKPFDLLFYSDIEWNEGSSPQGFLSISSTIFFWV